MASTIFNSGAVKLLKSILRFKNSEVQIITGNAADPTVTPVNAVAGSIYVRSNGEVYIKNTSGSNTDFRTVPSLEELNDHINDIAGAHAASAISNTPSGNVAATDVQTAVNELQSDIDNRALDSVVIKKDGSVPFTAAQSMGGFKLTSLAAGTASSDAINKGQFDGALEGLKPKAPVRVATTATIDIASAPASIDGITLVSGDRILLKDQTLPEQNGIRVFTATSAALTRSTDFDSLTPIDEVNGSIVAVQEGTANAGKIFVQAGTVAVLDTDPINFVFFNSISGLIGGDGITVSGANLSVDHDGAGLTFVATQLALELDGTTLTKSASGLKLNDTAVTPGSYGTATQVSTITLDQQGRATSASNTSIAIPSTQITDFNEASQDAVGGILVDSSTVDFTYDDAIPSITASVVDGSITNLKIATGIDAVKIADGSVDNTEFQYLNGVTSSIQTQLNNKSNQALLTSTSLADADATLTGAQMFGGLFTITPSAARTLTTDTAVNIIAAFPGSIDNNYFTMTITSLQQVANPVLDVTLAAGVGVTIVGKPIISDGSSTFIVRRLTSTTVEITSADSSIGRFYNGAAASPTISFTTDPDTGMFRAGANLLGFSTGGVQNFQISTTEINSILPNRQQNSGSAATPGYSWVGDSDTGLYSANTNTLGISTGGVLRTSISTTTITNTLPILGPNGTAAAPTYSFSSSTDTGLFRSAVGVLGIATGGVSRVTVQASGADFSIPIAMGGNAITGVLDPVAAQDAATKNYVDTNRVNTALSNLGATAVNASIIPAVNNAISLGGSNFKWSNLWIDDSVKSSRYDVVASGAGVVTATGTFGSITTGPDGSSIGGVISSNGINRTGVITAEDTNADAVATNAVFIGSGNKTAGTGNSGDVTVRTGTSSGGTRGGINLVDSSLAAATVGANWTLANATTGKGNWVNKANFSVYITSGQALTAGLHTTIVFNQSRYETNIVYDNATGNFQLPRNGKAAICCRLLTDNVTPGTQVYGEIRVMKNGSSYKIVSGRFNPNVGLTTYTIGEGSCHIEGLSTDVWRIEAYYGVAVSIINTTDQSYLDLTMID